VWLTLHIEPPEMFVAGAAYLDQQRTSINLCCWCVYPHGQPFLECLIPHTPFFPPCPLWDPCTKEGIPRVGMFSCLINWKYKVLRLIERNMIYQYFSFSWVWLCGRILIWVNEKVYNWHVFLGEPEYKNTPYIKLRAKIISRPLYCFNKIL
jgi:hypothetical protein